MKNYDDIYDIVEEAMVEICDSTAFMLAERISKAVGCKTSDIQNVISDVILNSIPPVVSDKLMEDDNA